MEEVLHGKRSKERLLSLVTIGTMARGENPRPGGQFIDLA